MTKTNIILKTLALVMALCMLFSAVACTGGGDVSSDASSDDVLYNPNLEDDDDEDVVVSGDAANNNGTGTGTGTGTGNTTNPGAIGGTQNGFQDMEHDAEKVDVDARNAYLASVPAKFKGTTVELYVWWDRNANAWEGDKFDDFEAATGVEIKYIVGNAPNEGDYYTKLNSLILSQSSPDIAAVDGANFPGLIAQNYFEPLSKARLDLDDDAFDKGLMDAYKYNGKYYAAVVKSTCVPAELRCLYYNKDMFRQYGVDTPLELYKAGNWNWDEWIRIATEMQQKTKNNTQISVDYGGRQVVLACGEDVIMLNNGTPVNNFNSKKVRDAWQFNSDLNTRYNLIASGAHNQFIEGEASMALAADYNAQSGGHFEKNIGDNFEWGIVPVPSPKGSATYVPTHFKGYGIPRGAENPEAAGYVIRYWLDDSMNRPGSTTWVNSEVGDMIHHLWELPKSPDYSFGIMNYGEPDAGMGGSYGAMAGQMSNVNASNIATVFDSWSGTADKKIQQLLSEAVNK